MKYRIFSNRKMLHRKVWLYILGDDVLFYIEASIYKPTYSRRLKSDFACRSMPLC